MEDKGEEHGRVRKPYQLTKLGRRILKAEMLRLESLVAVANEALAGANA